MPRGRVGAAIVAALIVSLALGCGLPRDGAAGSAGTAPATSGRSASPSAFPVTVQSADGRDVTVTDASRVLPLLGSINEVVFSLGLGATVVGRDMTATFPEAAHLPLVSRAHDISAEGVLALQPSVVIAQDDTGPPEAIEQIRNAGVPVVIVKVPANIAEINPRIRLIAKTVGADEAGERLVRETDEEIARVQRSIPSGVVRPIVAFLYMRGQAGVYLMGGPASGADSMIEAAGALDAGTSMGLTKAFTPITSEALVAAAPEIILMTTTGLESVGGVDGLVAIPGIAQTPAGIERRIVTVEDGLLYSFGKRTPAALQTLIDQLYRPRTS